MVYTTHARDPRSLQSILFVINVLYAYIFIANKANSLNKECTILQNLLNQIHRETPLGL